MVHGNSTRELQRRLWIYLQGIFSNELDEDSDKMDEQPTYIKPALYHHQKTLLNKAINLEKTKRT